MVIVIILAAEGINSLNRNKVDTSEGLKIIKQASSADVKNIENKMEKLEEKDRKLQEYEAEIASLKEQLAQMQACMQI